MLLPVQLWGPRGDPVPVPALSRAGGASPRGHLTWDLVQELVGGAGQDADPIQLWHQVGVLIQDKSVLPAKGSREGSGAEPAQPRSVPLSPTPLAGPHEPPPLFQGLGEGTGITPPRQPSLTPGVSPPSPKDTGCTPWSSRPPSAAGPTPTPRRAAGCGAACTCGGTPRGQGELPPAPLQHRDCPTAPTPGAGTRGMVPLILGWLQSWADPSKGSSIQGCVVGGTARGGQPGGHSPNHLLGRRSDAAVELAELLLGKRRVRER